MLFLPSDPDAFPTGPLRKIEPEKPVPPSPKDTWKEVKPGIFQNGLGEMKTGDMRPGDMKPASYTTITIWNDKQYPDGITRPIAPYSQTYWVEWLKPYKKNDPSLRYSFS